MPDSPSNIPVGRTFLGNFSSSLRVLFPYGGTSMTFHKPDVESAVAAILSRRKGADSGISVLAGVSGIDGSGKGFVTDRIIERLLERGIRAVGLRGDGWLNLPDKRFSRDNPGLHFYGNALRLDDMMKEWVLPLKKQ